MMKNLGQRYVQYVNRTYRRSGTLWEGRFKSCLTQNEGYVLNCYRYIELNPVRAGMVQMPGQYPWSSYAANALGVADSVITPHPQYMALGKSSAECTAQYRRFVASDVDDDTVEEIRHATQGNYVLGNNRFKKEMADVLGRRVEPAKAGRPFKRN